MATEPPADPPTEPTGTAIVERTKAPLVLAESRDVMAIIPRNIEEAQRYASGLVTANQVPDAFRVGGKSGGEPNAPLILMGILKSMEVGLPPQTGLASLLPLNGRFTIWGDGAQALVQNSGNVANHTKRWTGQSFDPDAPIEEWPGDFGCVVQFWRRGQTDPYIGEFTVRDARRASLWNNSYRKPWILYPKRMLFNRARAFVLRDGFADALCGLSIAEEVLDSMPPMEPGGASGMSANNEALEDEPITLPAPTAGVASENARALDDEPESGEDRQERQS